MNNSESAIQAGRYRHYFVLAFVTMKMFFVFSVIIKLASPSPWTELGRGIGIFLCLVSFVHTAIWSVLGPGGTAKRMLTAFGVEALVAAGLLFGIWISAENLNGDGFGLWAFALCISLVPIVVAAQVPFWILRVCFGWQLAGSGDIVKTNSLKQLFIMTLMFCVALAIPQMGRSQPLQIGAMEQVEQPEESVLANQTVEVTAENIKELRAKRAEQQSQFKFAFWPS